MVTETLPPIPAEERIETPENVWLTFRPAGPAPRAVAYLLDLLVRIGVILTVGFIVSFLGPLGLSGLPLGIMLVAIFFIDWGYGTLLETFWNGKTVGKHVMKLRVVKVEGYPISFYDAMLRNLLRAVDMLPPLFMVIPTYGLGAVCMLSTRRMQRVGDLAAGTMVVHESREILSGYLPHLYTAQPIPASELEHAYRPSERTLDLIEVFFLRARSLPPARADEIAGILSATLAERLGYHDWNREAKQAPGWFLLRVLRTFAYPDPPPGSGGRR